MLDRLTATKAGLDLEGHELQATLSEQRRLFAAEKARLGGGNAALRAAISARGRRQAADLAKLESEKTLLQAALSQQGERLLGAEFTHLEGEKAAPQVELAGKNAHVELVGKTAQQEQRLLAQADNKWVAWKQEGARLLREHEALVDKVRALVLPS